MPDQGTGAGVGAVARDGTPIRWIAAAVAITVLDGFDAFSLSLAAPRLSVELGLSTEALGRIFAISMAGMILGSILGGVLADRVNRLYVLVASLALFGLAALLMPLATDATQVSLNRLIAGAGLGAAAPIAVSLLNRSSGQGPSDFTIALVWAGIPLGGCLAALFNFAVVEQVGWKSIFIAGGVAPLPVAVLVLKVFAGRQWPVVTAAGGARLGLADLFRHGRAARTLVTAAMFFFGYVTTSIIVFWLPTVLDKMAASPATVLVAFVSVNVGGVLGMLGLGYMASRTHARYTLAFVWTGACFFGLAATMGDLGAGTITILAVAGYTIAAGAQALSVALANGQRRAAGLATTSVGFMTGAGRFGQASALTMSGAVIALLGGEQGVFAIAGLGAALAAIFAVFAVRPQVADASGQISTVMPPA